MSGNTKSCGGIFGPLYEARRKISSGKADFLFSVNLGWQTPLDLTRLLDKLAGLLTRNHISGQQVIALVNYMLQAGEAQDARTLLYEMAQRAPQYGDELMTLAEQLKQEGRVEGIQQGMQQGIQQGLQTGKREAARHIAQTMLKKGMSVEDIMEITGLSADELPSLQH